MMEYGSISWNNDIRKKDVGYLLQNYPHLKLKHLFVNFQLSLLLLCSPEVDRTQIKSRVNGYSN